MSHKRVGKVLAKGSVIVRKRVSEIDPNLMKICWSVMDRKRVGKVLAKGPAMGRKRVDHGPQKGRSWVAKGSRKC